jgi:hypothetical protein
MARYSIADTTLTALGDAVRGKVGETEIRNITYTSKTYRFSCPTHSSPSSGLQIPVCGATTIKTTKLSLDGSGATIFVVDGKASNSNWMPSLREECIFSNFTNDYIVLHGGMATSVFTVEFEAIWYDADGNQMEVVIPEEVSKTMTPERMATEIESIVPMDASVLHMSGNMSYKFYGGAWDNFLNLYGSKITTQDVTRLDNTFYYTNAQMVPFEINCDSSKEASMANFCQNAKLTTPPIINNLKIGDCNNMFASCNYIREFPEGYGEDWDWTYHTDATSAYKGYKNGMLNGCYSLRKLPLGLLKYGNPAMTSSYHQFRDMNQLYCLDSATKLPCPHKTAINGTGYSGIFYNMFNSWSRCQWLTFASDVGPMKWAKQTIDLSQNFGWATSKTYILSHNSGITADKEIKDEATYIALRNDPDWWTLDVGYSRYDLQSAISTINSLPDCSEYTASYGANTIKFKGSAGSKRATSWAGDTPVGIGGAAISNLTDEHIAVAAAKGWTVAIV